MSYPLKDLRSLLSGSSPNRGIIVRVSGSVAEVATMQGLMQAQLRTRLQVGATVTLRNGYAESASVPSGVYQL